MYSQKEKSVHSVLILIIVILIAALGLGIFFLFTADARAFRQGEQLMKNGQYEEAIRIFEALPEENGSFENIQCCHYGLGNDAQLIKDYAAARDLYLLAGDYRDAATQVQRMTYALGHEAFLCGDYAVADNHFAQLEGSQADYGYYHFATLADAVPYLDRQRLSLSDRIEFHIDENSDPEFYETLRNIFPCQYYYASYYEPDQLLSIAGIHYYPGENILYALNTGSTDDLTPEEQQVLALAQQVVAQAQVESSTELETELWLHDWLCAQVEYESPNMDVQREEYIQLRELSCIGAMLDGIANCQGYADAFYLLGNMAGLSVDRILGDANGGHIWNTVTLGGRDYIVDVTFDDYSDQDLSGWGYTYFNTFWDTDVYDPDGQDALAPQVSTLPDLSQSYFTATKTLFHTLEDAAASLVRQYVEQDQQWTYAMVQGNVSIDHDALDNAIQAKLKRYPRAFSWTQWLDTYGNNTYITVYWQ